jgi:riboflavin kinase/FMN adenylyltransferase
VTPLLTDPAELPPALRDGHVVVGNFDGVHRGHAAVIAQAAKPAHAAGRPVIALTFEPHPRTFFQPDRPLFRLTPAAEKARMLARAGADATVVLNFDAALAAIEAEAFVADVLATRLAAHTVVVGWDFHFGRDRKGSPAFLAGAGPRHGMFVEVVPPFGGPTPVSSSAIRDLLAEGDLAAANRLLGRRWIVEGEVVHGDARGRDLGYPTANIRLAPETRLKHGIYAVRALVDGRIVDGAASYGRRPQFDNGAPLFETYLLDFSDDLYGKRVRIELVAFLRPEEKFESVEALIAQMDRDVENARTALAAPEDPLAPSALE